MADDLDEKNKQVKDNFMDEITKIVKKMFQKIMT